MGIKRTTMGLQDIWLLLRQEILDWDFLDGDYETLKKK